VPRSGGGLKRWGGWGPFLSRGVHPVDINAYSDGTGFLADLAYKTRRLVEESASQEGLGRFAKAVTFDTETLTSLRSEPGPDEGKAYNLVRGLRAETDENTAMAVVLLSLRERAERILKNLEERKATGLAAMDELAELAAEKGEMMRAAQESGLTDTGFAIFWTVRNDSALETSQIDPYLLAREVEALVTRFPNWAENSDEGRRLRLGMYKPLLALSADDRARIVDEMFQTLVRADQP
jgi:type I restriction enzyme R subunit